MTHRSSGVYIVATLLEHGGPMTRQAIGREVGVDQANIDKQLRRLIELGLAERRGEYANPGTGRLVHLFGPGPLVRLYALRQKPEVEE